jgi:uncharacterized repeat protein (TIGR03803 family)
VAILLTATVSAQTFKVLHVFTNSPDGAQPSGGLLLTSNILFGTTARGGTSDLGTLFHLNPDGTAYIKAFDFDGSIGKFPNGGLVENSRTLYGVALSGGSLNGGAIFSIGNLAIGFFASTAFVSFSTNDGISPNGNLALSGGTLYGTMLGYVGSAAPPGGDNVYKFPLSGSGGIVTNLTGMNPNGGLAAAGTTLYGTTRSSAMLYRLDASNTNFTSLKPFATADGSSLNGSLLLAGDTLYGTAKLGGASAQGTLFTIKTNGTGFAVLKSFPPLVSNTNEDGAQPTGGLALGGDTLFGTTTLGGLWGNGVVFKIKTDGSGFSVLKHFSQKQMFGGVNTNSDGISPNGNLILNTGTLYGTTSGGGPAGKGVVFRLVVVPEIQVDDGMLGVLTNKFGFTVTGVSNQMIYIEGATNPASPTWTIVRSKVLTGAPYYFTDSLWTNYPYRFYRLRVP